MTKNFKVGAGVALLALSAVGAQAQVINTPTLTTETFFNDNNLLGVNSPGSSISNTLGGRQQGSYNQVFGLGVGFDPNNTFGAFNVSATASTAQTVYNPFIAQSGATAGSQIQIGLHGFAASATLPTEDILVSIFAFNPNAGTGNVPLGAAITSVIPVTFASNTPTTGDFLDFSAVSTLTGSLVAGQEYVIAFAPSVAANAAAPDSFGIVDRITTPRSNVQDTTGQTMFIADNNSANTGGPAATQQTNGPVAFRVYTQAPVPEASTVVSFGALLVLGGLVAFRRRRSA